MNTHIFFCIYDRYLMTLIRMNHILLKTLETYSQEKSYIAINKKRTMRMKKKKTSKFMWIWL